MRYVDMEYIDTTIMTEQLTPYLQMMGKPSFELPLVIWTV